MDNKQKILKTFNLHNIHIYTSIHILITLTFIRAVKLFLIILDKVEDFSLSLKET